MALNTKNAVSWTTETISDIVERDIDNPDFQRTLDLERVEEIVNYQKEQFRLHGSLNFLGCITICTLPRHFYLVDGMHRYEAMKELAALDRDYMVLVQYIDMTKSRLSMEDVFFQINKVKPVDEYIMSTLCDRQHRRVVEEVKSALQSRFKAFFSPSSNPRRPHVNLATMLNVVCSPHNMRLLINNAEKIINFVMWVNDQMHGHAEPEIVEMVMAKANKVGGASKPFFLAWEDWNQNDAWEKWLDSYLSNRDIPKNDESHKKRTKKRKAIPQALRHSVWNKYFGQREAVGKCFVCKSEIYQQTFECGHVQSDANGGECKLDNLRPVCRTCNASMGKTNMDDYCREHGFSKV